MRVFLLLLVVLLLSASLIFADHDGGNSGGGGGQANDNQRDDAQGLVSSDQVPADEAELYPAPTTVVGLVHDTKETRRWKNAFNERAAKAGGSARVQFITNHGGPIMSTGVTQPLNVYFVYYGTFSTLQRSILEDFVRGLNNSAWWSINHQYTNNAHQAVSKYVNLAGICNVPLGSTSLSDSDVFAKVTGCLSAGTFPVDLNAVYMVLTDPTVNAISGFCTQYCGWHWYGTYGASSIIKYAFIGNPSRCPASCAAQTAKSPNGDIGADGMVSIIGHELSESATDPLGTTWYDSQSNENADKCAWTFGNNLGTAPNGSKYNVQLGQRKFLIQQNWRYYNANTQSCGMAP